MTKLGEFAADLQVNGLDLAVRAGYAVNPDNVRKELPKAVRLWRDMGLDVGLLTLETSWVDPFFPPLREIYHVAGESGIPFIKIGYWLWNPEDDYWQRVRTIRQQVAEFGRLSRETGTVTVLHTHSGGCYGSTAHSVMDLAAEAEEEWVGIYLDPAHLILGGEKLPMALSIVGQRLKVVAAKNAVYSLGNRDGGRRWEVNWCRLEKGLVNWREAMRLLISQGFDGPVSVHGEYSLPEDDFRLLDWIGEDVAFLKQTVEQVIREQKTGGCQ
ncbi:MAG: sugar phosphate isomerase/epimerase [Armatimonadetes bacterium]|nr:sugar phosphate isomerase/epimerase [Armatimonadota bacterium]MDW8120703.1 sugar phosphate isomerase/epimerase [Armatimonadota bacterium]